MEWIFLESLLALAILVGIVWWTAGARRKPDRGRDAARDASNGDPE